MNLEGFGPIFRFACEDRSIRGIELSGGTIKFDREKKLMRTETFSSIKSVSVNSQPASGEPSSASDSDAGHGSLLEVIVGLRTIHGSFPNSPLSGLASRRNPQ